MSLCCIPLVALPIIIMFYQFYQDVQSNSIHTYVVELCLRVCSLVSYAFIVDRCLLFSIAGMFGECAHSTECVQCRNVVSVGSKELLVHITAEGLGRSTPSVL